MAQATVKCALTSERNASTAARLRRVPAMANSVTASECASPSASWRQRQWLGMDTSAGMTMSSATDAGRASPSWPQDCWPHM